ncbi:energy transducer TonB [Arcobacter defluvii]|uniref:Energy transduction protein TonB n=1 Tax=Arcobacter defluvii TaxID=873191 RepID=A0AAE7BI07_9BACT|nr:energy transducer TonB [Arcobacter defluvii]QKF78182.1 energy transduction protein TonB [Arcobacter defluvii]RXI33287.1 hypothetical protein CP964_06865 [Arcobacter defluvii]
MNNSLKAFIISLLIHASLFAMIFNFEEPKPEKKELIILNMNMIQNISQVQKQEIQQIPEIEKKIEEKVIEPEPIKEPTPIKKEIPKKIEKKTEKPKIKPLKKIEESKKMEEITEKVITKEEIKKIEKVKTEPNYQQKYLDDNLASIIKAIKKYKKYPLQAKKRGMIGKTLIQCTITTSGKLINIKILEGSKHNLLDENSIEILTKASKEFVAPQKDVTLTIPFNYELN